MSRRDDSVPMRDMLDHAREAVAIVRQRSRAELDSDRMLQLALRQLVEIVGEAANRVSKEGQARYPDIAWRPAIAVRNRIAHGYDAIDYDIVWRILTEEFPVLIAALERALPGHTS
jgi:uncharacterized protein with HEPN domain